jgi:uncharacterized protein (TIGR02001 family)
MTCRDRHGAGRGANAAVAGLFCLGWLAWTAPVHAASPWSATLTATSDYIYRGVSQTYARPAIQAGYNYQDPQGWFAGAWGSRIEPYPYDLHAVEIDVYTGMGWQLSPRWSARASYTRYLYAWDQRRRPYDYGEFALSLGFEDRLAATVSVQPDGTHVSSAGYARNKQSLAYELSGRWPLPTRWHVPWQPALVGSVGYYDQQQLFGASYVAGAAGVRFTHRHLELELMHFVADHTVDRLYDESSADDRWTGSLTWRF